MSDLRKLAAKLSAEAAQENCDSYEYDLMHEAAIELNKVADLVEKLQQHNNELVATVEQITKDLTDLSNAHATDEQYRMFIGGMAKEIKARTINQQNLNEVKREAFINGANFGDSLQVFDYDVGVDIVIQKEANIRYPSGKDGG